MYNTIDVRQSEELFFVAQVIFDIESPLENKIDERVKRLDEAQIRLQGRKLDMRVVTHSSDPITEISRRAA